MTSLPGNRTRTSYVRRFVKDEWFLGVGIASTAAFVFSSDGLSNHLPAPFWLAILFFWLFAAALGCCLSVVRHADHLAIRLGEPYGTLILTLAVTIIEVISISSLVVNGTHNPAAIRDTIFAVIMILLNGTVGFSLLLGGWQHREQHFNLLGANTYIGVIIPLTVFSLLLPNYTTTTAGPTLSARQEIFVAAVSLGLYIVFLAVQTVRHRAYFELGTEADTVDHAAPLSTGHHPLFHAALVIIYMILVAFLAEQFAAPVDGLLASLRAPASLSGAMIALLVATPEALSAVSAASANRPQRSMNILLGSVVSTSGLTIPVMLAMSRFQGSQLVLGLQSANAVLLVLTLAVSLVTFSSGRTNILQGAIHLILFGAFIMLAFEG